MTTNNRLRMTGLTALLREARSQEDQAYAIALTAAGPRVVLELVAAARDRFTVAGYVDRFDMMRNTAATLHRMPESENKRAVMRLLLWMQQQQVNITATSLDLAEELAPRASADRMMS